MQDKTLFLNDLLGNMSRPSFTLGMTSSMHLRGKAILIVMLKKVKKWRSFRMFGEVLHDKWIP